MSTKKKRATQAEIIRTIQKDLQFTEHINENVAEVLQFLSQNNRNYNVIKFGNIMSILTKVFYHGFASMNQLQTLGEEYTGIIQTDKGLKLPNKLIQLVAIILEFGGLHFCRNLLKIFEKQVRTNEELLPEAKEFLLNTIKYVRVLLPYINAIHRGLFYINGGQYQISKRLTRINYVIIRFWLNQKQDIKGFRILGIVTVLHALISLGVQLSSMLTESRMTKKREQFIATSKSQSKSGEVDSELLISTKKCILCLELRQNSTATECGHVFCWTCICDWLQFKNECPICREPLKCSSVIPLMNFL